VATGLLLVLLAGASYTRLVGAWPGMPTLDSQGAISSFPAFQIGLYLAVWVAAFRRAGWTRFFGGFALLMTSQVVALFVFHALADHAGLLIHVRDVRLWAIAGPLLALAAVVSRGRALR
jgi:hypothetical protein